MIRVEERKVVLPNPPPDQEDGLLLQLQPLSFIEKKIYSLTHRDEHL